MPGIDSNTLLYLRGDSLVDLSPNAMTLTPEGGVSSVNGRVSFTAGSSKIIIGTAATLPGDFTFEWWSIPTTLTSLNTFDNRATETCFLVGHRTGDVTYLANWFGPADNWADLYGLSFGDVTLNTATHYACVRSGTTYYAFKNGVLIGSATANQVHLGLNGTIIGNGSTQTIWNARISNVARWTSNFEPPTEPYTSASIEILSQDDDSVTFAATTQSINEVLVKVDVLLNGTVINTYTSGYENITCPIDNSLFVAGENNIEIRAYYFENYYVSSNIVQMRTIDKLGVNPTLLDVINKLTEIKDIDANASNRMISFLADKNVAVSEDEKNITTLISKMQIYSTGAKNELTSIINEIGALNNQLPELTNSITALNSQIATLNSQITSLNSQVTSITSTNNTMKSNLVTAINKFGASATTSQTFSSILNNITTIYDRAVTGRSYLSYSVSIPSGTPYGFTLNSNGFFESTNKGVHNSYALCSVYISNGSSFPIWIDYIAYGENNYDYGLISQRGYTLSQSASADTSNVLLNTKGKASAYVQTVSLNTYSSGTVYIKYIKDSSTHSNNDSFQFRVRLGL